LAAFEAKEIEHLPRDLPTRRITQPQARQEKLSEVLQTINYLQKKDLLMQLPKGHLAEP
jgi:hypothetical protein